MAEIRTTSTVHANDLSNSDDSDTEIESFSEEDEEEHFNNVPGIGLAPYQCEPISETPVEVELNNFFDREIRVGNNTWCECGHCQVETTPEASFCCTESPELSAVRDTHPDSGTCITNHPGFHSNCLDPWVLQAVYNHYRTQYGRMTVSQEQRYRFTAYRNLVYWAWGRLGRHNRVPLPSCVLKKIRARYPDPEDQYTGFRLPQIGE